MDNGIFNISCYVVRCRKHITKSINGRFVVLQKPGCYRCDICTRYNRYNRK